jgi:multiple sugar transport system permease protein
VRNRIGNTPTYVVLLVFLLPVALPLLWMVSTSLRTNAEVAAVPISLLPDSLTFSAFRAVFADPDTLQLFVNSYVISLSVAVLCVLLASLAAYGFSRFTFRGKRFMLLYILLTQMFPLVLLAVPFFLLMSRAGLYDTYAALIIANLSFALPFSILMLRDFIDTIPRELDEAATVDGCSPLRTFFMIILPTCIPGLVATAVYAFILAWNEFLFAVVLTNSTSAQPLPVGISLLQGEQSTLWNEIMAVSLLGSIPLVIVFMIIQRFLVAGLTAGSVKG